MKNTIIFYFNAIVFMLSITAASSALLLMHYGPLSKAVYIIISVLFYALTIYSGLNAVRYEKKCERMKNQ